MVGLAGFVSSGQYYEEVNSPNKLNIVKFKLSGQNVNHCSNHSVLCPKHVKSYKSLISCQIGGISIILVMERRIMLVLLIKSKYRRN